ncbi:MAG: Gfo/Idh/MocA family oxidoreductase [Acidobacteria bacterium]|nr:Gfo/Idh/MocA family oxidoreductase [Acidobacteriota bacterium]
MTELRSALIGAGFVGRAHIDAIRRLGVPITGVLGSSAQRTEETRASLGLPRAYASLQQLAADPDVHVVHVCTPNHLHFEQVSTLLRAGKHVMCEKPLAMDTKQSAALIELARTLGRVGGVTYNLRYYPLCQEARSLIASGAIGEPRLVCGGFLQDWLFYPTDWNWRLETQLGGDLRAVSDIGTHWLDLTTWLTGRRVQEVCADLATVIPVRQRPRGRMETFKSTAGATDPVSIATDDYASVLLHFEGGLRGVMTVSQVSAGHKAMLEFEINGSEGSLAFNSESPNELWIGRRNEANRILLKDPSLMRADSRTYSNYPGGHAEGYPDTFFNLFRDFYSYIQKGEFSLAPSFPTFQTGHDELVLCEAIGQSARNRLWVRVD